LKLARTFTVINLSEYYKKLVILVIKKFDTEKSNKLKMEIINLLIILTKTELQIVAYEF